MATGKKTGGRSAGTPNKQTVAVKQCLINAFEQIGGWQNLAKWGMENQTEFYKLWARMIPHEVTGEDGGDLKVTIKSIVHTSADEGDGRD